MKVEGIGSSIKHVTTFEAQSIYIHKYIIYNDQNQYLPNSANHVLSEDWHCAQNTPISTQFH